ncbi:5173_t:CDS:2, partial [Gigaspora rosea]
KPKDWKNYATVLQSSLKDSQALKRINIVQPEIDIEKKELDQAVIGKNLEQNGSGKKHTGVGQEIDMLQVQNLDEEKQDLRGWKKSGRKKCLLENTSSRNKEIQKKIKKQCEMIVNNQGQMLN